MATAYYASHKSAVSQLVAGVAFIETSPSPNKKSTTRRLRLGVREYEQVLAQCKSFQLPVPTRLPSSSGDWDGLLLLIALLQELERLGEREIELHTTNKFSADLVNGALIDKSFEPFAIEAHLVLVRFRSWQIIGYDRDYQLLPNRPDCAAHLEKASDLCTQGIYEQTLGMLGKPQAASGRPGGKPGGELGGSQGTSQSLSRAGEIRIAMQATVPPGLNETVAEIARKHLERHKRDLYKQHLGDGKQEAPEPGIDLNSHLEALYQEQLAQLNGAGSQARFKDLLALKVPGGRDQFSSLNLAQLKALCQAGDAASVPLYWACTEGSGAPEPDEREHASVLRWILRGLIPGVAVRKVLVDREVSRNAAEKRQ